MKIFAIAKPTVLKKRIVPNCKDCRYNENNTCKLFKLLTVSSVRHINFDYYADTDVCRDDPDLCGPDGIYFKQR